jgi:hypothetical protein
MHNNKSEEILSFSYFPSGHKICMKQIIIKHYTICICIKKRLKLLSTYNSHTEDSAFNGPQLRLVFI